MYALKRVQITCPSCKYEFPYNKAALEDKIKFIGQRIYDLNKKIAMLNKIPKDKLNINEYKKAKKEKQDYTELLTDLKLTRETLKNEEERIILINLKKIIKEQYGEEVKTRLFDEALRRSAAYETSDMMSLGYYSHAGGRRVRKV